MKRGKSYLAAALLLIAVGAPALRADTVRNHFDSDAMMREPGFFDFVVLGAPGKARWMILSDMNPPSTPYILAQTEASRPPDSIAAALRRNQSFQDGAVTTFLRRGPGRSGLLLRMADERTFLVLLVDTATGEAVLSGYREGKASELGRGRAALDRGWEQFGVVAAGPKVSVLFNGEPLFEAVDPAPAAGRTGVATAGPNEARFDEFVIETGPAGP